MTHAEADRFIRRELKQIGPLSMEACAQVYQKAIALSETLTRDGLKRFMEELTNRGRVGL